MCDELSECISRNLLDLTCNTAHNTRDTHLD